MEDQTKPKLTLNPDEEKKTDILQGTMPVRQTVQPVVQAQSEYSAGSIDESMLSSDEKEMVEQFANEIDIGDRRCELCLFLEYSSMWSKWCGVCIYLNVVIHKFPRG